MKTCPAFSKVRPLSVILPAIMAIAATAVPAHAQSYGVDEGSCDRTSLSHALDPSRENILGSMLGAAAGGLLGSQFGHGSGKSVMTIAGVLGGALAGGTIGRSMEAPDQACVNRTLEYGRTGQTVAWRNPDNGTTYDVTPTENYTDNGRHCRRYRTTAVIDGQEQTVTGHACRQPDGTWKQE